MAEAMALREPDRVPVMCQLAIGHYFLHAGLDPAGIWFTSDGFAEALVTLQRRYRFDGILVNLPGRDPAWERHVARQEREPGATRFWWKQGGFTIVPDHDNPHRFGPGGARTAPRFRDVDPAQLVYVEPWDVGGIAYPYRWGFDAELRPAEDFFPAYHFDAIREVRRRAGDSVSVHSEVFSPFSQFVELLTVQQALLALHQDAGKVRACLDALAAGTIALARRQAACGVDAILISSAFAGAGLIGRRHYADLVLPCERRVIAAVRQAAPELPVYTHTCGSIGDRLDLMLETGTCGIDTLDPPPLGTVVLEEAKPLLQGRAFIKGNLDPVHTLLEGSEADVRRAVLNRLAVGGPGGGYILSSACSVAPATPPERLEMLTPLAEQHGRYPFPTGGRREGQAGLAPAERG